MINSIEITDKIWNAKKEKMETVTKTVTRKDYDGDFERLILRQIDDGDVKDYAKDNCDLIDEDDLIETGLGDFDEDEIIDYLEEAGHKVIKCQTITDSMRFQKLKEIMEM